MASTTPSAERTIRCGVFQAVSDADRAVGALRRAGFRDEQISVLCSDESKERHFGRYGHEDPSGQHAPDSAAKGGLAGAAAGGLLTLGLTTAAGIPLLALGPGLLVGGAVAGGFVGAMQTRGEEGALADFYDQALTRGDLLVAVTDEEAGNAERLSHAERILRDSGSQPVSLDTEA